VLSTSISKADKIINLMKQALEQHQLTDEVNVSAAFCLGQCTTGVTVKIDEEIVGGVSEANFNEIFAEKVLKKFGK
jgi:NADH:ubiquinone oxidoreductase subunit E